MKKIILICLMLLLVPLTSYAISFDELTNNPSQFKNIYESKSNSYYIDTSTINTIRYAPPYYTMKVQEYIIDYNYQRIMKCNILINYNYNRNPKTLATKLRHDYPSMPSNQLAKILVAELNKDSGITTNTDNISLYKFNGEFVTQGNHYYNQKVPLASPSASVANYIFYKGYNIYFFNPTLIKRN